MIEEENPERNQKVGVLDENQASEVLSVEYENAKNRLKQQRETLKEFSKEGMRMFRLLLLLVAAPAAILGALKPTTLSQITTLLISSTCAITSGGKCSFAIADITFAVGFVLSLCAGVNVTAAGFEARGSHDIVNPEDIHRTISMETTIREHRKNRLEAYRDRIDHNDRVISGLESLLGTGKMSLWFTTYGLATLSFVIIIETTVGIVWWGLVLCLSLLPLVLPLRHTPKEYREADRFWQYCPVYDHEYDDPSTEGKKESEDGDDSLEEEKESDKKNPESS